MSHQTILFSLVQETFNRDKQEEAAIVVNSLRKNENSGYYYGPSCCRMCHNLPITRSASHVLICGVHRLLIMLHRSFDRGAVNLHLRSTKYNWTLRIIGSEDSFNYLQKFKMEFQKYKTIQ